MVNRIRMLPAAAALAVALCTSGVLYILDVSERARIEQEQRVQIAQQLSAMRAKFEGVLNSVVSSAQVLASSLRADPRLPQARLSGMLADLIRHNPSIRNIAITEGTVIKYAYPLESNQQIIGVDYRNLPAQWPSFARMMETRQAIVIGPVELIQHEPGVIVRAPVLDDAGHFRAAVSLPIRLKRLMQDVGLGGQSGPLVLALRNPAHVHGEEVFYGDGAIFGARPVIESIVLPGGGAWEIAAQPAAGWSQATPALTVLRAVGITIGILLTVFAYGGVAYLQMRRESEQSLKIAATVFEAQEGMMVTNADTIIQRVNKSFTRITGYEPEEVIGHKPNFLQSGKYDSAFYSEMWDRIRRDHYWQGEIWSRRKNGELYLEWLTITAVYGEPGRVTHYVAGFFDITHTKDAEEKIRRLAFYDPLTLLPNRRLLIDRLTQALPTSSRSKMYGALLFIDLDDFKTLNDTRGHDVGDLLLVEVAQRLQSCVRESDTVSRFGGDEFVVMLENVADDEHGAATQAEIIGEKIRDKLGEPYRLHDLEYHSSCSVGLCLFFGQEVPIDELLKRADTAMYQAKRSGRNALRFFDPDMQLALEARLDLNADLRQALKRRQMQLYYQVQVQRDGRAVGAEVLLRWLHPERGLVSPVEFIPLAEESGMILNLGHWVLEHACRQLKLWEHDARSAHLKLSVNVSARQFRQKDFVSQVRHALETSGANPDRLRLELTESIVLEDITGAIAKMQEIKALGVRFSMDDFGTGYSSLAYLTQLPLDELKIDQSFVHSIGIKHSDSVIVQTIVAMAHTLGIEVIAEGVETAEQRDFLCTTGCQLFQGYFYGKPVPLDEFEVLLSASPAAAAPGNDPAAPRTPAGQPG